MLDPNLLNNLENQESKMKVLTPPPTPPRQKTPSIETEIAESEIIIEPEKEEIKTFYNEPIKVEAVYNLTNKDHLE